jgi:uridylate kinase
LGKFVIKVGGSLLFDDNLKIRNQKLKEFGEALEKIENLGAIVVGGGKLARVYINSARKLDAGESICDTFGIEVSRLNARLLITALGKKAYPEPIINLKEARVNMLWDKILLAGGFVPGQSTTSVTFEIAEAIKATNVIILTNVDGVYDKDPNKHKGAKKFDKITIDELESVIYGEGGSSQSAAGEYRIFDAVSMQIFKRSEISVRLMSGENLEDLKTVLSEKKVNKSIGTEIVR